MNEITRVLSAMEQGDPQAAEQLLPLVYEELRKLAGAKMALENPGQTLQATALVHEAYLRLVASPGRETGENEADAQHWDSRGHFFAAAAEAMRRILVENARRKNRVKRGGDLEHEELNAELIAAPQIHEDLVSLDAALDRLKMIDPQAVQLVHLRYFVGLSNADAAKAMGISSRTASRVWSFARAWLHQEVRSADEQSKKK